VAPGGTLLVVGHHPSDLETTAKRLAEPGMFYTGADLVAALEPGRWRIVVDAASGRDAGPEGEAITIHDTVLRAERLAEGSPG
jgi:hypothetical protein